MYATFNSRNMFAHCPDTQLSLAYNKVLVHFSFIVLPIEHNLSTQMSFLSSFFMLEHMGSRIRRPLFSVTPTEADVNKTLKGK